MHSYILASARTPTGRLVGGFASLAAPQLAAVAIRSALSRSQIDPEQVQEVILGQVLQAGVGQSPARQAALSAGLPASVAAVTVNKVCGSGLKAVMLADQAIRSGDADVVIAGGMESMSRAPHLLMDSRTGVKFGAWQLADGMIHDGLRCAVEQVAMGELAEQTARKFGVQRPAQDEWAQISHHRAFAAAERGEFDREIAPVVVTTRRSTVTIARDEGPRGDTSLESLSKLSPAFCPDGTVTAGNASQISDGAAALVVVNAPVAAASRVRCQARIVASAVSGVAPRDLFIAPISAMEKVLAKAGLKLSDIDLIELNEAFAAQCLACCQQLHLNQDRVNVRGGAIALGHPIGASGARVLVTLVHALQDRGLRRGLAALCLGGGNAVAMIVESPGDSG